MQRACCISQYSCPLFPGQRWPSHSVTMSLSSTPLPDDQVKFGHIHPSLVQKLTLHWLLKIGLLVQRVGSITQDVTLMLFILLPKDTNQSIICNRIFHIIQCNTLKLVLHILKCIHVFLKYINTTIQQIFLDLLWIDIFYHECTKYFYV